jgi:hypothetical protein
MDRIDKLTLEYLMNKNTYNRYIEKADPNKYKQEQQFREKINKYKSKMISLTLQYLDNHDFQVNNELDVMMDEYAKTFIKYFEMKDLENVNEYTDDQDTMFVNMDSSNMDSSYMNSSNMDSSYMNSSNMDSSYMNSSNMDSDSSNMDSDSSNMDSKSSKYNIRKESYYTLDNFVKRK